MTDIPKLYEQTPDGEYIRSFADINIRQLLAENKALQARIMELEATIRPKDGGLNAGEVANLLTRRIERLEKAIRAVLGYISSHQVYDKDARGVLERALE